MNEPAVLEKARSGDETALSEVVENNMGLVRSIAVRFRDRGVEMDDLMQIGSIGLIKAIRNFDTSYNTMFSTYAVPLIMGEIKKHLRDDGTVKVSRETKRRGIMLSKMREKYFAQHGYEPKIDELASLCDMTREEAVYALDAVSSVLSFSDPVGDIPLENLLGTDNTDELCESLALREAISKLEEDEQAIIHYRYYKCFSQAKTAELLGATQVRISRAEKKIIEKLKKYLA